MANVLTTNPIVLDTTGSTSKLTGPMRIKSIRWTGCETNGHGVTLKSANGAYTLFDSVSTQWGMDSFSPYGGINASEGIQLTKIDSGVLYVYC